MASGERPIDAASFRQQSIQASCQPPPPPSGQWSRWRMCTHRLMGMWEGFWHMANCEHSDRSSATPEIASPHPPFHALPAPYTLLHNHTQPQPKALNRKYHLADLLHLNGVVTLC